MDYHYATKQIFWSDPKSKKIYSALMELNQKSLGNQADGNIHHLLSANSSLQLHKVRPIIESGLLMPAGLAGRDFRHLSSYQLTTVLLLFYLLPPSRLAQPPSLLCGLCHISHRVQQPRGNTAQGALSPVHPQASLYFRPPRGVHPFLVW